MSTPSPGDQYKDEHLNSAEVISVNDGVVRIEYELPLDTFLEMFELSNRATPEDADHLLLERLAEFDMEFPAVEDYTGSQAPLPDDEVRSADVIEPFDLEQRLNLNALALTLGLENIRYEPEIAPGLVWEVPSGAVSDDLGVDSSQGDASSDASEETIGVVLIFEDGTGVALANSDSDARSLIQELTDHLVEAGLY